MSKLLPGDTLEILDEASAIIYVVIDLQREAKESSLPYKVTETDLKKSNSSHL